MIESYESNSEPIKLEKEKVLKISEEKLNSLKSEIALTETYKNLKFSDTLKNTPSVSNYWFGIIGKLEKYKNDNSLKGTLLNNPEIKNLLTTIVSEYANQQNSLKARYLKNNLKEEIKKDKSDDSGESIDIKEIESRWDYALRESSYEKFEDWLISEDWVHALMNEIDNHIDNNWNPIENYPIDGKSVKVKLEQVRLMNLRKNYNSANGIYNEAEKKFNDIWLIIKGGVESAVKKHIIEWWNAFDGKMIDSLKSVIFGWENGKAILWLKENSDEKDELKTLLREYIKNYSNIVWIKNREGDIVDVKLNTWSNQLDLELRSYLFIYGKTFIPEIFDNAWKNWYDSCFTEWLKLIFAEDYEAIEKSIKNKSLLEKERKVERERELRDLQRRQEAVKRNRERNNQYSSNKNSPESKADNTSNSDNKTWSQIVKESGVDLRDINVNNNMSEEVMESWIAKQTAFWYAWKNFSENNPSVRDIFTPKDMRSLYDINSNTINIDARNNFLNTDIMKWRSTEEIKNIYNILASFPNEYSNALKHVASNINRQEWLVNNEIKNHALWLVIDNVRDIFDNIVQKWKWDSKFEWFKFSDSEPVKREWNDIIISGTFDWKDIKVRYDLISWWLFMNSYIKQSFNPSKFVIWDSSEIDYQVWELDSFDTILSKNYSTPDISLNNNSYLQNRWNIPNKNVQNNTNTKPNYSQWQLSAKSAINRDKNQIASLRQKYSEMLHSNIDMIGEKIIDNTKKQSAKNSVVMNFMKTFNIITDNQEDKSLEFNDWSNLFDFIQLVENSDSQTLDKFQIFMEKIINPELSWLEWWKNNLLWSKLTFDKNNFNKNKSLVINNIEDFSNSPEKFNRDNVQSFGSSQQLWFAQLIIDNITDDSGKPNWKLDPEKMDKFIYHLETDWEKA